MRKTVLYVCAMLLFSISAVAQYSETFDVPNKGILSGPCSNNNTTSCGSQDFAGVNWTLEGTLTGITATDDYFRTEGGALTAVDIDEEICWVSPLLDINGTASFSLNLSWLAFDDYNLSAVGSKDYIDVAYRINGGSWVTLANAVGGGPRTISYVGQGGNINGSISGIGASNLTGSTLQIRVCVDVNASTEVTTIDNVTAVNASLPGSGPTCDLNLVSINRTNEGCPGANDGTITVNATSTNGPIIYTITGPVNASNQTGVFTGLPDGNYAVSLQDGSFAPGVCTESGNTSIAAGVDNTPPTATAPSPVTVDCPADIPAPNTALVTNVNDNCMIPCVTEPWINEFHYDNIGTDINEFIEVAGPAGIDLSSYTLYVYDGFNGEFYNSFALSGTIPDQDNGFGAVRVLTPNLQNQTEGIALVKSGPVVIEFISYEGVVTATNGPASGMTSTDVGVAESNSTTLSTGSLGLVGNGNKASDFIWTDLTQTQNALNTGQIITDCPDNEPTVAHFADTDNGGTGTASDPLIVTRTYRVTDAYGNTADLTQTLTANNCINTWTGNESSDWNAAGNWSLGVPDDSEAVVVAAGPNQPVVNNDPTTPLVLGAVTIENGAMLTVRPGKALTVSGNFTNNGTTTLESDATGTGTIITLGTVGGSGTFIAQQYLTGSGGSTPNGRHWYVAPTVGNTNSGAFSAADDNRLWAHDETVEVTGANGAGWTEITDNATALSPMRGYLARLGATETVEYTGGTFNTGDLSLGSLTRTGTVGGKRGYNLAANPYPSFLNWDDAWGVSTDLMPTIWYRTEDAGSMIFATYNAFSGLGVMEATEFIHPGQAFWVRVDADGNTGTLALDNTMRSHREDETLRDGIDLIRLTLTNGTQTDEAMVFFNDLASNGADIYDSEKQMAPAEVPQLWSNVDGTRMAINGINSPETQPTVPLGIRVQNAGEYTITATELDLPVGAWLEDITTGAFQSLDNEPSYAFSSEGGTVNGRFVLHFSAQVVGIGRDAVNRVSTDIFAYNRRVNIILSEETRGTATVMDMAGRVITTSALQGQRTTIPMDVATGVYVVRVETEKGVETRRVLIN